MNVPVGFASVLAGLVIVASAVLAFVTANPGASVAAIVTTAVTTAVLVIGRTSQANTLTAVSAVVPEEVEGGH